MVKVSIYLIVFFLAVTRCQGDERQMDYQFNPGCPPYICGTGDNQKVISLMYIISKGQSDWLHFIWDLTGKPSILFARTPVDTNLTIDWNLFMDDRPKALTFSSNPIYTATIVINKLWQFNDTEDTGTFPPAVAANSSEIKSYDMELFTWSVMGYGSKQNDLKQTVVGKNAEFLGDDGEINLNFMYSTISDYDDVLPHLLVTENSTQMDIVLNNITVDSNFQFARFAFEVIMITDEHIADNQSLALFNRKSLDDEHTPGIFHLVEIASPASCQHKNGSYIQYRPVSYTHPERDVTTSTELHITTPTNLDDPFKELNASLAWSYYGYRLDKILVQGFNVSFGLPGDGFYSKTKYNSWTFITGYGTPPKEQLSMFIIIVGSIGLGLPLLLLMAGGCYICIKRARRNSR